MPSINHQYGRLISKLKNVLTTRLQESITEMFIKSDEHLFEMAESTKNNEDRNRYFELMHDIRALKNNISTDFIDIYSHNLRPFAKTADEKKKLKKNNEGELSLMDQDEQEDRVLVKGMSDRITGKFHDSLSELEARLEHLALQTSGIFYKNALHPSNVFQAFDDAIGINFSLPNKKTLFKFFNDHVALQLGKIYDDINNILINADILPQIKLHPNKSDTGHYPKQTKADEQTNTSNLDNPEQDINQGGYAMTAQPGHAPNTKQKTTTDYQHSTAGMPANQVNEVISDYLGGTTPLMPTAKGDNNNTSTDNQYFPTSTGQYYGHQEILNALSNVQHNPVFSNSEGAQFDGEAIKQAVLSEIAKSSGGGVTKSINRIAEKTIDFIELIFDAIIDDEDISDTIKTLLLRLQIPVIKASMLDQEFFIYDDHPARVLLDKIAHTGIGVASHKDEAYIHLDKIVTTLVNEFELQADSFQTALDSLNNFLEKRETSALKKEEEAQRQVLREHARNTVLKSLRTATRGKILPETIHTLVLKRWPTMMYNHYLKLGKENDEWVTIVDTLRSIINSVQPFSNINDLDHLISTRDNLIESTCNYLKRTNQSEEDIEQVLQDMREIHQSLIDQADFDEADEIPDDSTQNTAPNDDIENEADETPKLQLPSNIVPGMWFQIFNGEDKAQRRCKLSVVILEDQKLVFVNYQGEMIIEKELGEFLDEMANGKSKVIMGHSIFDHALNSVVNHLQKPH